MKRIAIFSIIALIFIGCFSPWQGDNGEGTVTISVGTTSNSRAMWGQIETDDLEHRITATDSSGKVQNKTLEPGESSASFTTASFGPCTFVVEGWLGNELKSWGTTTVNIKPGKNDPAPVEMGQPTLVIGVSLNKTATFMATGTTETLTVTFNPESASSKTVTWSSSNNTIATVSNGTITAHSAGTATITVTTLDGNKTASCTVTIVAAVAEENGLKFTLINNSAYRVEKGTGAGATISIPATFNGLPVTTIAANGFQNLTVMTSLTIPASVTSINNTAFNGCTGLTTITVADGNAVYRSLNNCVLQGNTLIFGCKNSTIPTTGVTTIGTRAFYGISGLSSVTIPNTVSSIGDYAFYGCGLQNVTISSGVTRIGDYAFSNCTNLISVTFAAGINLNSSNIGNNAFPEGSGGGGNDIKNSYGVWGSSGTYTRTAGASNWYWNAL
ncbi:MAG: leucine-rich repeat protein [Treponema sp.]|jgi:hypothetical protein|nr:leucine-rich repeat protein [Treponema sp.]